MTYTRAALTVGRHTFDALWALWDVIPFTPNPMNPKFNVRRKQATFGSSYEFAGQKSICMNMQEKDWPELVRLVVDDARTRSGSDAYNVVHVNWYPDGGAGLAPHADDIRKMVPGMCIYSYTFLSEPGNPRGFQVYTNTDEIAQELLLDDGDLVVMTADMQKHFKHGVKKSTAKRFKHLKRINLTVRAFKS